MTDLFIELEKEYAPGAAIGKSRQSSVCVYQHDNAIALIQRELGVDEKEAVLIIPKILRRLITDMAVKYLGVDEAFCSATVWNKVVSEYDPHYFSRKLPGTLREFLRQLEDTEREHYPRKGGVERMGFGLRPYEEIDKVLTEYNKGKSYSKRLPYGRLYKYFLHKLPLWTVEYYLSNPKKKKETEKVVSLVA